MKTREWWIIVLIMLWAGIVSATSTPTPTQNQDQSQEQQQEQSQGQIQGQTQEATGIGIGVGIADSTAISGSSAIVGVNSENENTNVNMNVAQGGQGGAAINSSYTNNLVNPFTISESGDSEAINNVTIGAQTATSGDSASSVGPIDNSSGSSFSEGSQAYSGGNTMTNSYISEQKLDSYDTWIQVGNVRKSVPNISGYAGMSKYRDESYEFGVRMTIPLFTSVTDKALEFETNRIEVESLYLNAQINALNATKARDDEQHVLALNKAQMEIALLCEPFLKELESTPDTAAYGICKNYKVRNPVTVERIVEVPVVKTKVIYRDKIDPCEKCAKNN
jgi:hypothetical protein